MSFDPVKEFANAKKRFSSSRGVIPSFGKLTSGGQLLVPAGSTVPAITWGDAYLFGQSFLDWVESNWHGPEGFRFTKTASFQKAEDAWKATQPLNLLIAQEGAIGGPQKLAELMKTQQVFPYSEDFWGYGSRFANSVDAASGLPSSFDYAIDSIKESVKELPSTLTSAIDAVVPSLPNLSPMAEIIKWGSIGGALFLLYWYVLRPKKS